LGPNGQFVLLSGYILARETQDQFQVAVMNQVDYRLTEALQGNFVRFRGGFHLEPETGGNSSRNPRNLAASLNGARASNDVARSAADEAYEKEKLVTATVDAVNARTDELNQRVVAALVGVTGRDANPDPANWWQWWSDFTDTQLAGGKGTVIVAEDTNYVGDPYLRIRRRSCFAAGTPVWTESGPVPIESIKIGDRVLAQNIENGELAYKTVLCTTIRPAKPLVSLQIGDETITATSGHRFWVTGEGWTKARDLVPKTLIHTVTGNSAIGSVETGPTAETYNLVIESYHNYFVGRAGFLVQDLPLPQPTNAIVPGLARASTASHVIK
ncbi:MAG TPA: polymorphic toxin-type HINT domain-containing protein, partial [Planctomycetaceae bacterium]